MYIHNAAVMEIVNITALIEFGKLLEFPEGTIYNNARFPGGIYKKFGATFLIVKTGKGVVVGVTSSERLDAITGEIGQVLGTVVSVKVKNIVAAKKYKFKFNLDNVYDQLRHKHRVIYEPELFAGLRLCINDVLVTIFHTGKSYITGAKSKPQVYATYAIINKLL